MLEIKCKIQNRSGMHARPAVMLVQKGRSFKAKLTYTAKGRTVDGKNIIPLTSLGLQFGDEFTIRAEGPDEKEALEALKAMVDDKFGEPV